MIVVNNGARKGLAANAYETISKSPGIEGVWQLHKSDRTTRRTTRPNR